MYRIIAQVDLTDEHVYWFADVYEGTQGIGGLTPLASTAVPLQTRAYEGAPDLEQVLSELSRFASWLEHGVNTAAGVAEVQKLHLDGTAGGRADDPMSGPEGHR